MSFGDLLFSFEGRTSRAKFWLGLLIQAIGFGIAVGLVLASSALLNHVGPGAVLAFLIVIPVLISNFAVGAKRLHDRDKSGWWLLLFFVLPAVLGAIDQPIAEVASALISLCMIVELGCLRGTSGANSYGVDPLESASVRA